MNKKPYAPAIWRNAAHIIAFSVALAVLAVFVAGRSQPSAAEPANSDNVSLAPLAEQPVDVADYFVVTSRPFYEEHSKSLGEMAVNLHFYDFDHLVLAKFGEKQGITCLPIECNNGDMVYDYSFYTSAWKVELCTQVEEAADAITSYIVLVDPLTEECVYESISEKVEYRIGNYLTNMHAGTYSGESHLFQIERQTFVNFLAMVRSDAFAQTDVNPFEFADVPYRKCENPAN